MRKKNNIKRLDVVSSELKKAILENEEAKVNSLLVELDKSINEEKKVNKGSNILITILSVTCFVFTYLSFQSTNITKDTLRAVDKQDSLNNLLTTYLKEYQLYADTTLNLASQINSLSKERYENRLKIHKAEVSLYERKLFIIDSIYNIKFVDKDHHQVLEASKVDSALKLLPYYRNKLRYNKTTNRWQIEVLK